MNTPRLISALAVAGVIAAAAAPSASAATTEGQSASSANWSGYVAGGGSGSATRFSSVSGSWTEPNVDCSAGQGYSAFWVGIGGAGQQSQALEQTGTEANCSAGGSASHFAWYELVPAAPVRMDLKISPGDHITGKVTVNGTNITVTLSDSTTGQSATKNLTMQNPDTSSAEWIAEAPSQCGNGTGCQPLPLSDFGTVNFSDASATANGHTGTISDSAWASQPVQLTPGANQLGDGGGFVSDDTSSAGATPSDLSSDGSAFSVKWGSSAQPAADSGSSAGSSSGWGDGSGSAWGDGSTSGWGDGSSSTWGDSSGSGWGGDDTSAYDDGGWGAYVPGYAYW
jgi:peptidase A4-like protein